MLFSNEKNEERFLKAMEKIAESLATKNSKISLSDVLEAQSVENIEMTPEYWSLSNRENPEQLTLTASDSKEAEFLKLNTQVYYDETKRKHAKKLKRKSGRVINLALNDVYVDFLKTNMPQRIVGYDEQSSKNIVVYSGMVPTHLFRFYTDLGYYRFGVRSELEELVKRASELGIPPENIYLVVTSTINGLNQSYIEELTGKSVNIADFRDNKNRHELIDYLKAFKRQYADLLPNYKEQIFFLTATKHPNVIADLLFESPDTLIDWDAEWIEQPFNLIFEKVQ